MFQHELSGLIGLSGARVMLLQTISMETQGAG